jgi:hypothetical protein
MDRFTDWLTDSFSIANVISRFYNTIYFTPQQPILAESNITFPYISVFWMPTSKQISLTNFGVYFFFHLKYKTRPS